MAQSKGKTWIRVSLALIVALMVSLGNGVPLVAVKAAGLTLIVNSTADLPDIDVSIPTCVASNGLCTLRAAILQANFTAGPDTIILPAGTFTLDRPGLDDQSQIGDLDITDALTLQGAGSGLTIVDGNGSVTGDRVFQILASAVNVSLSGLTIKNGKRTATFDEGGGLYWDGGNGQLKLSDVVFENNSSPYGGGLFLNYSASADMVTLDHVSLHNNTATAAAGGLGVNFDGSGSFSMTNSQAYSNTAYEGGGVYFQSNTTAALQSISIQNSAIYSNNASLSAGFENRSGSAATPIAVTNSNFHQNQATTYGGAIGNYGALSLTTATLDANSAVTRGGGLYNYEGGMVNLQQSTLSNNTSTTGGGIYSEFFIHNASVLTLTNTTLSGNTVSQDGAGIYADGGLLSLYNATLANNRILAPLGNTGLGGGVYVNARVGFAARNTLIAGNTHTYPTLSPVADDCLGALNSLGFNLIQDTTNCAIAGDTTGNITGQNARLGLLQNTGGPTLTQAPQRGSLEIDAGQTPNCTDANNAALLTDQRGFPRPSGAGCDIGAVETLPYTRYLPYIR